MIITEIKKGGTGIVAIVDGKEYWVNGIMDWKSKEELIEKIRLVVEAQNAEISDVDFNKFKIIFGEAKV